MKVSFAIFFFVILGVTSAKHLMKEEYKGFGTVDELDELYLPASDETEFDDPEENRKKVSGLMESIKVLADCLEKGDVHRCFKKFEDSIKLPPHAHKCFTKFERCYGSGSKFFVCADAFKACVHGSTSL